MRVFRTKHVGRAKGYALLLQKAFSSYNFGECSPEEMRQVDQVLALLPNRDERYLRERFGLSDGNIRSQRRAALLVGVRSKQQAAHLEERAINELRHPSRRRKLVFLFPPPPPPVRITPQIPTQSSPAEKVLIGDVGFSSRAYNALTGQGLRTLGDIAAITEKELRRIPGIGKKSLTEILEVLKEHGLAPCGE